MSIWRRLAAGALLLAASAGFVPEVLAVAHYGWEAVPAVGLTAVLAVSALLLLGHPAHRRDGWWLVGATAAMGVSALGVPELEAGYWVQLAFVFQYATAACLVPPFLRYPAHPAPARTVSRLTVSSWVVLVGIPAASAAFWQPAMQGYTGPTEWFAIYPWEAAARGLPFLVPVLFTVVVLWFTVVQWRRQRSAGGPGRTVVRLLAFLTIGMAWGMLVRTALNLTDFWHPQTIANVVHVTFTTAAMLLVLAVAIALTARRAAFIDDLVAAAGQPAAIQQVLRRHAADPSLRLLFLTDEGWTDADGQPVSSDASIGRASGTVVAEDGEPVVKVEVAENVDLDDPAVHALVDGAGFVLRSARLSVLQAAQARELRESRRRIVEASVHQRRQFERDLHDGAQQHLLAAQAALSRADLLDDPEATSGAIQDARIRLASTMEELRRLARGVHPALLSQAGLGVALASLTSVSERVRVEVAPELNGRRFAPVIEATAWFVASEGVVNALKHHDAPITVRAGIDQDGSLVCTVTDEGPGGATLTPGGGLAGLRDRVHAAGGSLALTSEPGKGTSLTVRLAVGAEAAEVSS